MGGQYNLILGCSELGVGSARWRPGVPRPCTSPHAFLMVDGCYWPALRAKLMGALHAGRKPGHCPIERWAVTGGGTASPLAPALQPFKLIHGSGAAWVRSAHAGALAQGTPARLLLCARLHNVEGGHSFHNLPLNRDWEPCRVLEELAPVKPLQV